jgi:outer membrane receptor protein involved in Fe transport
VDSTVYDYENPPYLALINLKAYTLVNARIGYVFVKNTMEVSLSAFNLFNQNVYDGLPGTDVLSTSNQMALPLAEELGRRVTTKVSYKF